VAGVQAVNSTAHTITGLSGESYVAGGAVGYGVAVGAEVSKSASSGATTLTRTAGLGGGGFGLGYAITGTAVPSGLSVSCQ
jgi:hypothetical protein